MTIQTKPNIQIPWAETGTKEAFTEAKLRQGWVSEIPKAENENWSQNRQDLALIHIFQSGVPQWDGLTPYTANKSYVTGSNGYIYVANSDNTGQDPTSTTAWRLLIDNTSKLVNESRTISTSGGIQGGGNLSVNRNISLSDSGVNSGQYGSSGSVPQLTIDSTGRVTTANNQAIDFVTPFNSKQLSQQGFQRLPGGMLMQWGLTTPVQAGTALVSPFPTGFTSVFNIQATYSNTNAFVPDGGNPFQISAVGTTAFALYNGSSINYAAQYFWFAIGV